MIGNLQGSHLFIRILVMCMLCLIGHIAKLVEQLIRNQRVAYSDEHSFITPDQFAYLKGHSTQTSLHRVIDDWLENVNESQITGNCKLDIAKCFDPIDHDLLLKKLSLYGIKNVELEWFKSYLHQRLCNGKLSSFVDNSSGVQQGSVIGPFLFLLLLMIFPILLQVAAWQIYLMMTQLFTQVVTAVIRFKVNFKRVWIT